MVLVAHEGHRQCCRRSLLRSETSMGPYRLVWFHRPLNDTPPGCVLPKKIGTRITYSVGSVPAIITNSLAPRSGVARGARPRVLRGRGPSVVRSSTADHC